MNGMKSSYFFRSKIILKWLLDPEKERPHSSPTRGGIYFLLSMKQRKKHLFFLLVTYVHPINPGEGKRAPAFALIPQGWVLIFK